jgi:MIP family channel proteins
MIRSAFAEYIGTLLLVLAGTAAAVALNLELPNLNPILGAALIGLTFGLTLTALIGAIGHISGAHFNPAVSLGLAISGAFPLKAVPFYLVAQVVGAFSASEVIRTIFGPESINKAVLGMPIPAPGTTYFHLFLTELVITFLLVFVVIGASSDSRAQKPAAGMSIGAALAVAIIIGGPISGGSANPASALGPMLAVGMYPNAWVYILAPLVGGALAALCYKIIAPANTPK